MKNNDFKKCTAKIKIYEYHATKIEKKLKGYI